MSLLYEELTSKILEACFQVSNELGAGFLESVYKNALLIALEQQGLIALAEQPLKVNFRNREVGQFYADILVDHKIIVEVKAVSGLTDVHKAQVINYLKATGIEVGLLVNFGTPKLEFRRLHRLDLRKQAS